MRWYWTKIALAACAIFVVGLAGMRLVQGAQRGVERVVHSSSDLSLPLPFVSFNLDGVDAGKFRRLVLHRSDPERLSGIDVSVRVADAGALATLTAGCHLTLDNPKQIGRNSSFRCVEPDSSMQTFGEVAVQGRDAGGSWVELTRVPLVLPRHVIADLGGADVAASVAGAEVDDIQALADSIREVSVRMARAQSDQDRAQAARELRRLRYELREIEQAVTEVTRAKIRAGVRGVTVEVSAPEPPVPPEP